MKLNKVFTVVLFLNCCLSSGVVFSRDSRRASSKLLKISDLKNSSGLVVTDIFLKNSSISGDRGSSAPGLRCGAHAKLNADGSACECEDPVNYVLNTTNPIECYQKVDPVVLAQKKACGNVFVNQVNKICRDSTKNNGLSSEITEEIDGEESTYRIKCYDANDLFLKLDTSSWKVYVDGKEYDYDNACYIYTEELAGVVSEDYSITGANSLNCKLKRVIAEASSDCFQIVLSSGKSWGYGKEGALLRTLEGVCGIKGLKAKWDNLFGDEDMSGVTLPTDIPTIYLNAGKIGAENMVALTGNLLDGKITDKSSTWERDITQILNAHIGQVGSACGKEYEMTLHDVNLQIVDEKSSLERAVEGKGLLKGTSDWGLDQASVFIGEDKTNRMKKSGTYGSSKDRDDDDSLFGYVAVDNFKSTDFSKHYDDFKVGGMFIVNTNDKYAIIKVSQGTADTLDFEVKKYSEELDLPKKALKLIIGKTEADLGNLRKKIEKE